MGNKYSQISNDIFPCNYFVIILCQPDIIQIINAEAELIKDLIEVLDTHWHFGIKNEKRFRFGLEVKLNNSPFANDPKPMEKLIQINLLCSEILSSIINNGYEIISSGCIIKSFERSTIIFRKLNNENLLFPLNSSNICSIIFEGWNQIVINNIDKFVEESIVKEITKISPINVINVQSHKCFLTIELDGQPWDSHKSNSNKSPLLFLNLIRQFILGGYKILLKAHITGYNDTVFFRKCNENISMENEFFVLSLNQLDQLRAYSAPSATINKISDIIKSHWYKGIHSDSIQDKLWTCRLNGSPWSVANWDKDTSFSSKLLIISIFNELNKDNWQLTLAIKLYRSQYDKSLFLFQRNYTDVDKNQFFLIGPHDVDRFCLTGSPKNLINHLQNKFLEHWTKGIREDSHDNGCNEYVMEGNPWYFSDESFAINLEAIGFFCWVVDHSYECSCSMVESADICSTSAYSPTDHIFSKKI